MKARLIENIQKDSLIKLCIKEMTYIKDYYLLMILKINRLNLKVKYEIKITCFTT